jgi:diacylglycerol O-acyltransferase
MAKYYYDTLTPTDYGFLVHESPKEHMHVTGLATFTSGPLAQDGGVDFAKLKKAVADVLHRVPMYRQKLMWVEEEKTSLLGKATSWVQPNTQYPPVWVDDEHFDIDYHVRHTSLPRPGSDEQLKTMLGQIMSQQLDRAKPLWEVYIVEGLADGGFACITKMHHCMVDGESGIDLTAVLMHIDPNHVPEDGPPHRPRKAPTQEELRAEIRKAKFRKPWKVVKDLKAFSKQSDGVGQEILERTKAVGEMLGGSMAIKRVESPINGESSAQRIYEWLDLPLDDVKKTAKSAGATINDVVLATVTGAVRDYCGSRGFDLNNEPFRVSAPVSMRKHSGKKVGEGEMGNEVTQWTVPLPIHERSRRKQLATIHEETVAMKDSKVVLATQTITSIMSLHPPLIGAMMSQATVAVNTVVTNMPGPQFALYQCGAEMQVARPCVPLNSGLGLVIGVLSYNGTISFGLTGDPAIMDDLAEFREALQKSFSTLARSVAKAQVAEAANAKPKAQAVKKAPAKARKAPAKAKKAPIKNKKAAVKPKSKTPASRKQTAASRKKTS